MNNKYDIAIIPGDGVGVEVSEEAVKILKAVADKYGFGIIAQYFDWGCEYYLRHGETMPENSLNVLKDFDAIFLGCIGDANKVPDHISLTLLLKIRKGFDQYVKLRPIKLYPGVETPIKTTRPETVDLVGISAGSLCAFAIEASEKGRIEEKIDWGDVDKIAELLHDITYKKGLGAVLAEGIRYAAKTWEMENVAIHVKGLDPAGYDPRVLKGMGLACVTSDRGACHLRATFYLKND